MLIVLSPSKTLDFESKISAGPVTQPEMLEQSELLIKKLRSYSVNKIAKLMDISDKLANLNVARYQDFTVPFTKNNARPALFAFKGDVYTPMEVHNYTKTDLAYAQEHVAILSGLYGLLRPLDLIQPYRLEMGTRLPIGRGKDLYAFWEDRITLAINERLADSQNSLLVNLASEEYFKAVRPGKLKGKLLHVAFKERQKGTLRIIGLFAKKARGMMANYVIKQKIDRADGVESFQQEGYRFHAELSTADHFIFVR